MVVDNNAVRVLAAEIDSEIKGNRIDRIYVDGQIAFLKLRGISLFLSANSGFPIFFLTNDFRAENSPPSAFSMLFRKHFLNGKILSFTQLNNDRIIKICVLTSNELGDKAEKSIILELTGRNSNLILLDSEDKILGSSKQFGLSESTNRVILNGVKYTLPENPNPKEIYEIAISNEEVREYFESKINSQREKTQIAPLLKLANNNLKRSERKAKKLLIELENAKDREKFRVYGELLTANLHNLKQGKVAEVFNYYENCQILIELDEKISPAKNAERYFKKYAKLKTAEKELGMQIENCKASITYWESVLYEIESGGNIEEIKHELGIITRRSKKPDNKIETYYKDENCEIYVGKNNNQNDFLTFKFANKKDYWFHTQNIPSSHVILRCEHLTDELIYKAAKITCEHSRAKNSSKVVVDYCFVKNVKKPRNAKAGFVIYNDYNSIILD